LHLANLAKLLLAHPGTFRSRRSEFADHAIWVTPYEDRQLFPAGDYTNQSLGGTGIASWKGTTSCTAVRNEGIVIWHTYGFTHNPRVEDFPVMPAEIAEVHLKPYNFALFNPTNDVPQSTQAFNKSVLIESTEGTNGQSATVDEGAVVGAEGKVCGDCVA
jgi:primary-amine oxidase